MQIPLLRGTYTDTTADFGTSLPVNLIPVPKETGISKGYLRYAPGIKQHATGFGPDRGSLVAGDICYRVSGDRLIRVFGNGTIQDLGNVGGGGLVSMDYSFDQFCVVSGGRAFLYFFSLQQITDPDIGTPIDVVWMDGYFVFTDGEFIYCTELNDPFSIDPNKYASSEIDPDRVTGLLECRNELYVLNRNTIEIFDNVGGDGFPFRRIPGGLIPKGCVGTKAKTLFAETFAWVGSARNEPCSVYMASGGSAIKVATRGVEETIAKYSEEQLSKILVEAKADKMHQHLYIHLPNETLVYDFEASKVLGEPVWFYVSTGTAGINSYRAMGFAYCYGKWIVGDKTTSKIGVIDEGIVTQYDEVAGWQFDTMFLYNEGEGGIIHQLELAGTMGRAPFGERPTAFTSYTLDGLTWSDEKQASMGVTGNTANRLVWRNQGKFDNFRGQRFRGANKTPVSFARLQAQVEPLFPWQPR